MTYTAPTITTAGLTIPSYNDILNNLIAKAQSLFGSDIYLGTDSMDYQYISAVASVIYDAFLTSQTVYNARGITTATGSNLDILVKLNGLKRNAASYSTATVTLTGTTGTVVTNGVVGDTNGNKWTLTTPITINAGGTTALATCQTAGPITAAAGTITTILTPTLGWTSVTNASAATAGAYAETDAALRARQANTTALPAKSVMDGLRSAIGNLTGVGRYIVYENDTNATNSLGLPANSVTCVVENLSTTASAIANVIYLKKTPGCYTNGTTSSTVTGLDGTSNTIRFYLPTYVDVDVTVNVHQLSNYTTATTTNIQTAVANYISSLAIGNTQYNSRLWSAALSADPIPTSPTYSITSITTARHLGSTLSSALTSGTAYTSLSVTALAQAVSSGASIIISNGTNTQTVTASAAAAVGATTISVNSFTANAAYSTSSTVSLAQSTTDMTAQFYEVFRGNSTYITINFV